MRIGEKNPYLNQCLSGAEKDEPLKTAESETFDSFEPDQREWALFRAEGLPLSESLKSAFGYVRKYWEKKWTASPQIEAYFKDQKDWFDYYQNLDDDSRKPDARASLVGDIMWIRDSWDSFLQSDVKEQLSTSQVVFGNLETPVSDRKPVPWMLPDAVSFNAEPELVTSFQRPDGTNIFTALSFANNHTLDQGVDGALDTLGFLEKQGIRTSGAHQPGEKKFVTFEKNGIKFGFYGATWGLNDPSQENPEGLNINLLKGFTPVRVGDTPSQDVDLAELRSVLREMESEGVEQKVVALHWGHEFEMYPTAAQMNVAREIVQAGADIILGSHSHVVQPSEILFVNGYEKELTSNHPPVQPEMVVRDAAGPPRKALVVYSAGNFTTNMFTTQCQLGGIQSLEYHRTENGLDWDDPKMNLVFNQRGGFLEPRELKLAENADFSESERAEYERLKNHLPGS